MCMWGGVCAKFSCSHSATSSCQRRSIDETKNRNITENILCAPLTHHCIVPRSLLKQNFVLKRKYHLQHFPNLHIMAFLKSEVDTLYVSAKRSPLTLHDGLFNSRAPISWRNSSPVDTR